MALGNSVRLGRVVGGDGRSLIGTFAHGLLRGPLPGEGAAKDLGRMARQVSDVGLDAVMMGPGMLRASASDLAGKNGPGLIVCLEWNSAFRPDLSSTSDAEGRSAILGSVEDALSLGADGVITYMFLGWDDRNAEARHVAHNAAVSLECERLGVVRIIETMIRGHAVSRADQINPDSVAMAARMAYEVGCDLVKVEWPGSAESLAKVVDACPAPILVAGGDLTSTADVLAMARSALSAGAAGLVIGRNIVQATDRAELVRDLSLLVHGRTAAVQSAQPAAGH
jgi:DhnA family fructose-bisphosphate aldolase class Ia